MYYFYMTAVLPVSPLLLHRHCLSSLYIIAIFFLDRILYFITQKQYINFTT